MFIYWNRVQTFQLAFNADQYDSTTLALAADKPWHYKQKMTDR